MRPNGLALGAVGALVRKEIASAASSPGAYAGFAALFGLTSLFFVGLLDSFQDAQFAAQRVGWSQLPVELHRYRNLTEGVVVQLWGILAILVLFAAPLLSMRLFAEERRGRTLELLFASPATDGALVVGKFFGAFVFLLVPLLLCLLFPAILEHYGSAESGPALEWRTVVLGWLGVVGLAVLSLAVGTWVSAHSRSELTAALGTFAILLPWMLLGELAQTLGGVARELVGRLALDLQLRPMFSGFLVWRVPVFFLSGACVFLMLARRHLRQRSAL